MRKPIDIAVYLGVVPDELPEPLTLQAFTNEAPNSPPEVIEGVLHQGCKMVLGGTSKSNKSWALLDMAMSVASGAQWWGGGTNRCNALYINFELHDWAIAKRLNAIAEARPDIKHIGESLSVWNLRGRAGDFSLLRPELENILDKVDYGLIVLDPVYKLLGDRDENANGDVGNLMNEFEQLACRTDAAVVLAHHFAKGDSTVKEAIDRISGAGAWGRDPDSIMVMTPHEEEYSFTVTSILRNHPPAAEFVVSWDYPLLKRRDELNPDNLRTHSSKRKVMTDLEFTQTFLTKTPKARKTIVDEAAKEGIAARTVDRYLARLTTATLIGSGQGMYWKGD
jgi:hypothetical protein